MLQRVINFTIWGILWALMSSGSLHATHVVGGEMTYTQLGKDSYYINLKVYIDCENGNKSAISADSTGIIAVYEALSLKLKRSNELWRTGPVRLNKTYYNCVKPPTGVCVDAYEYDTIIKIKPSQFGYYIVYQRCCRNGTIINLENPLGTGATYFAYIPPAETVEENSSPHFLKRPPNYLCVNERIDIDHRAADADGDSLVYRICTPYDMKNINPNKPIPPESPPYINVVWQSGFSDSLPLPVKHNFNINAKTGLLRFIPKKLGQYVFGVCVDEYREGVYLSTAFRDFQFNIMTCQIDVKARFTAPEALCDSTYQFANHSFGADEFHWDFGVEEQLDDTSVLEEPRFTFRDTGLYYVRLVAANGNCADTSVHKLRVLPDFVANEYHSEICPGDTLVFVGTGYYNRNMQWSGSENYNLLNDSSIICVPEHNAVFVQQSIGEGCSRVDSYYVKVLGIKPALNRDSVFGCGQQTFYFSAADSTANAHYSWFTAMGIAAEGLNFALIVPENEHEQVRLAVDENGCRDTFYFEVEAQAQAFLQIEPINVISPNNDGLNDVFTVKLLHSEGDCFVYSLHVFNRWGQRVFGVENTDEAPVWDATNAANGTPVLPGTYFYLLTVNGQKFNGSILVVR